MQKSSSIVFYFAKVLSLFSIYLFLQILQILLIQFSHFATVILFKNHRTCLIQHCECEYHAKFHFVRMDVKCDIFG